MSYLTVKTDHDLREWINFEDSSFPVGLYMDDYSKFVNRSVNCHWHDAFEFSLIQSGEVDYYLDETYIRLKKGDCIFINANTIHSSTQCEGSGGAAMFTLVFPSVLLTGSIDSTIYSNYIRPIINSSLQGFKIEDGEFGREVKNTLEEISLLDQGSYGFELRCMGLVSQLWHATVCHIQTEGIDLLGRDLDRRFEQRAKQILSYIHEHYAENITVEDMAKNAGISRSECFRCFRRAANKKPVEYLNQYRLAQASRLLLETDSSVTEICTSCGFSNSSYFGKLFKETFGISPTAFRKQGSSSSS